MQLTEKTENNFLNNCIYCNFGTYIKFGDENVPHSFKYFWSYWLQKTCLLKYIKGLAFENPSAVNLLIRSSLIYNTSTRHEQHEQNECDKSVTRVLIFDLKILILITARVKTYFHTPIFTICQVEDYKEGKNFILRTTFWKCLVPMPKCVWKVHHKNWTF